jgi:hypothetical protein
MFSIQVSQELNLRMIIKGFATMSLCIMIDDMFGKNFPASIK